MLAKKKIVESPVDDYEAGEENKVVGYDDDDADDKVDDKVAGYDVDDDDENNNDANHNNNDANHENDNEVADYDYDDDDDEDANEVADDDDDGDDAGDEDYKDDENVKVNFYNKNKNDVENEVKNDDDIADEEQHSYAKENAVDDGKNARNNSKSTCNNPPINLALLQYSDCKLSLKEKYALVTWRESLVSRRVTGMMVNSLEMIIKFSNEIVKIHGIEVPP